jgi:DNA mismatch endonuclease (patch repair protein)
MTDTVSKEKRTWIMSRIRSRDTQPEIIVRSMLHRMGYRFTVNGPRNKKLPGKPDIVLPKWGTVVFVHGCFWHGHQRCRIFRLPKTRRQWWKDKIERNGQRDAKNEKTLRDLGWNVVVVRECELANAAKLEALAARLPYYIERHPVEYRFEDGELPKAAEEGEKYSGG